MGMHRSQIRIRDPFFLKKQDVYYLYGTTDANTWDGYGEGFDYYKTKDLEWYEGPYPAFRPDVDFWADQNFWAPEVWEYGGHYYMIASFKKEGMHRGVQILCADSPEGPFVAQTNHPVTPADWDCLDGTLAFENGAVYLIFCHEWLQVGDGEICAMQLDDTLQCAVSAPDVLFRGSQAAWSVRHREFGYEGYVTDGPYVWQDAAGRYHMLWSSYAKSGYALGISHADSLHGTWIHDAQPVVDRDGGHGMIVKGLEGERLIAIHQPNTWMKERVHFLKFPELQDN